MDATDPPRTCSLCRAPGKACPKCKILFCVVHFKPHWKAKHELWDDGVDDDAKPLEAP